MGDIPQHEFDRIIISALAFKWRSRLRVTLIVFNNCEAMGYEITPDAIHDRIVDLVEAGVIATTTDISKGDFSTRFTSDDELSQWCHGKICLLPVSI